MKTRVTFSRLGVLCAVLCWLVHGKSELRAQAQSPTEIPSAKSTVPDELSQTELLKSYLHVRDQLHATQLAIVKDRAEAEAAARSQATALAEKLDSIKVAMEADRERHRTEVERQNAERERQQMEAQRSTQTVLWVAASFGAVGILAMVLTPLFQWRAIRRVTEATAHLPQLAAPHSRGGLMASEGVAPLDQAVTVSNQRLVSVIDRLERRIMELEHTTSVHPLPESPSSNGHGVSHVQIDPESARRAAAATEEDARITLLLGKGRALLSTNKAKDAVACYDEILRISPKHAEALVKKGAALERLTRDEEAIRCYERAIEADRNMTLAYLYKGGVCNRLGRYDDALECYEQALQTEEASR